ncbi:MAG TPA: thermonuclease family protein [Nitrospirota bacterium]|nr:thermonuclease family protein [Nitrospirota bacterium]
MVLRKDFIVCVFFIALFLFPTLGSSSAAERLPEARVIAVNDGDTVTLRKDGGKYRSRLIGVDAPELGQEPWGKLARGHLRKLLKDVNWRVTVETDVVKYDKYDRILVYLWAPDGDMLNERMLRDGYALLFTIQPNSKYADRLRKAQRAARDEKRGIWGPDGLTETPRDYKKSHPRQ